MAKAVARKAKTSAKRANVHPSAAGSSVVEDGLAAVEALFPSGSAQRVAVGVAVAAGGALILAAMFGAGPTALAGAAGYLAYRGTAGH